MTNVLTLERVRAAAKKIADERGDTVYNPEGRGTCYYRPLKLWDDELNDIKTLTGCMVGELLKEEGLLSDDIKADDDGIKGLIERGAVLVESDEVTKYLEHLQYKQDYGSSWTEAYEFAEYSLAGGEVD